MNMKSKSGTMFKIFVGTGCSILLAVTIAQAQISVDQTSKYQTEQNQIIIQNQNQEMPDTYRMRSATAAASIDDESERPLLGVYVDETDYETAYKLHYENNYGARVEEVVVGGAAADAGLLRNDIIMEIDDTRVLYAEHLERLLQEKDPGEEISIKYFRDGRELTTTVTLQGQEQPERKTSRKRFRVFSGDVGEGGLSFSTGFYQPDHTELSNLIESLGFSDILSQPPVGEFDENGIVTSGFQIRFEGDNNWYWGFVTNSYNSKKRISVPNLSGTGDALRQLNYEFGHWGFSLEKRIPFLYRFIIAPGVNFGLANFTMSIMESTENFVWTEMNEILQSDNNNYVELEKRYILAEPNIGVVLKLNDWIGLEGRAGYPLGYSYHSGWDANVVTDEYEVQNSPETSLDGMNYSVGLWLDIF
jgi:hypothetical protein